MIRFVDISLESLDKEISRVLSYDKFEEETLARQISTLCRMALTVMARTDSLYYSFEHTVFAARIALEIIGSIYSRHGFIRGPEALHIISSALFCNVGIIRGVLEGDKKGRALIGDGKLINIDEHATDSALWKHRITRSSIFIENEPLLQNLLNKDVMQSAFENSSIDKQGRAKTPTMTDKYCRATQIIALMAHPNYDKCLARLYWSAYEGEALDDFGGSELAWFKKNFSAFFWDNLYGDAAETISLLRETDRGQEIVAALYGHL